MKRVVILLIALVIAVPLALGIVAGLSYYTTSDSIVPRPTLVVMETKVEPAGFDWREPVFGGILYKDFLVEGEDEAVDCGTLASAALPVVFPAGFEATAQVTTGNQEMWSGNALEFGQVRFHDNGTYYVRVQCTNGEAADSGHGSFSYYFRFTVAVTPDMAHGNPWVSQGDVLALRVYNLGSGQVPTAETTLGPVNFMDMGGGVMVGYVPVSHDVASGTHPVTVTLGEYSWEVSIRSIEPSFEVRYEQREEELDPEALEAAQIAKARMDQQYYDTIMPILDQTDPTRYWSGRFIAPVDGELINDYGMFLYTTNSNTPTRYTGIDLRATRGTPVVATADGRVVYTGQLTSSGNTVVIEHGGGLKSLYFYLNEITVEAGDTVAQGDEIGTVGSSGIADSSYLHFEMRQNRASINPSSLLDGTSNYYTYD